MARKRRDDAGPTSEPTEPVSPATDVHGGLTAEEREEIDNANEIVKQARQRLMESKLRLDEARGDHKACQAEYDSSVDAMLSITEDILHPSAERYPLFVKDGQGREPQRIGDSARDREWKDADWRPDRLADAIPEVGSHVLHVLDESEIRTMGDLADWTQTKRLDQIAGVGEAKAKAIEDAVIAYWSRKNAERDALESEPDAEPESETDGESAA